MNKKALVVLLFLSGFVSIPLFSQVHHLLPLPEVWLVPDSGGTLSVWSDHSGHGHGATRPGGTFDARAGMINYQPCFVFDSLAEALEVDYLPEGDVKLMVFSVYRPLSSGIEFGVWGLRVDSARAVSVSTQEFRNFYRRDRYSDSTITEASLNLVQYFWRHWVTDSALFRMYVAGHDSLAFGGKFGEFMLFDKGLTQQETERVHTYLVMKYGISIRETDLIDSRDSCIWSYERDSLFSEHIAGIGKDSLLLVDQRQSSAMGGEDRLVIAAGHVQKSNALNRSQLPEQSYLIWGDNGGATEVFGIEENDSLMLGGVSERRWLMRRTGSGQMISTMVAVYMPELDSEDWLNLLVNEAGDWQFPRGTTITIPADSADTLGWYYFNEVRWDMDESGVDAFALQKTEAGLAEDRTMETGGNEDEGEGVIEQFRVYPNPSAGKVTIELIMTEASDSKITIQDESGKVLEVIEVKGQLVFRAERTFLVNGVYLIQAESGLSRKLVKLINE